MSDSEPSEPPDPAKWIEQLFGARVTPEQVAAARERQQMLSEQGEWQIRNFLEGLTDEQVEHMFGLMLELAKEGSDNYKTFLYLGILQRELWLRRPLKPEDAAKPQ